jgi:flagellar biosynthetic protein FliR
LVTVGRALNIQAGFGLAVLVDPTTTSQMRGLLAASDCRR